MPLFTPGRRWQPSFYAFKKLTLKQRILATLERMVKGPLFGCRMCGNCVLQETAFICPMECPKGGRNGPCGGSTPKQCYVDKTRPCLWYEIYDRSFAMGREDRLLEVLPPMDWDKVGGETWADVVTQVRSVGVMKVVKGLISRNPVERFKAWESVFQPVRQPDWWQGDDKYHPPAYTEPVSELERRLRSGEFVVTAEVAPPLSTATNKLVQNINMIKPYVAAVNFTDNPSATPRMSSLACSVMALQNGAEPVMQIAARDRTRMVFQSDVIGANALGVRNILCLSGDHSRMGPPPFGRSDVIDMDSVQMLWILRRMRDEGHYLDGRKLQTPPKLFLGAAASPFASNPKFQALREHKKMNAGAQYFQTNLVFNVDGVETWLNELVKRDVLGKVYILMGISPIKSLKMAQYMHKEVPGVFIPETIMKRMEAAGDGAQEEGITIALELIEKIKKLQGISGIHVMAVGWEEIVPRLVRDAGLLPPNFVMPEPLPVKKAAVPVG
jgi:methylenetetrahydrofolate reductase (NADPH)